MNGMNLDVLQYILLTVNLIILAANPLSLHVVYFHIYFIQLIQSPSHKVHIKWITSDFNVILVQKRINVLFLFPKQLPSFSSYYMYCQIWKFLKLTIKILEIFKNIK